MTDRPLRRETHDAIRPPQRHSPRGGRADRLAVDLDKERDVGRRDRLVVVLDDEPPARPASAHVLDEQRLARERPNRLVVRLDDLPQQPAAQGYPRSGSYEHAWPDDDARFAWPVPDPRAVFALAPPPRVSLWTVASPPPIPVRRVPEHWRALQSVALSAMIVLALASLVLLLDRDPPVAVMGASPSTITGLGGWQRTSARTAQASLNGALERAETVARASGGRVGYAVALPDGQVVGLNVRGRFRSASLSKALLAVALLRSPRWSADPAALQDAGAMVERSDNEAATRTVRRIGVARIRATARAAGMRDFSIGRHWSESIATAGDYARLFRGMPRLVAGDKRALLAGWLEHIRPSQSWGIPSALRPRGARVLFKGGWRRRTVHQAARVSLGDRIVALAVLTSGTQDMASGVAVIRRIARILINPETLRDA